MNENYQLSRRHALTAGVAALSATVLASPYIHAADMTKTSGETKIVAFMGGDYGHNRVPYEIHIREIFSAKPDWRIIFVQASDFFTPELISDADLLILSRHSRPDDIGWRTTGLADSMEKGAAFWTDRNVQAIIDNVRNRGMGLMALHNTIMSQHQGMTAFLEIDPFPHKEIQPLLIRDLNQDHPITSGIGNFFINLDEQFNVNLNAPDAVKLFGTTAVHDKGEATGGWCVERG